MTKFLSVASGVVFCLGFVPYVWGMLRPKVEWGWLNKLLRWLDARGLTHSKRRVEPVRITWFVWTGLDVLILVGMYLAGTMNGQIISAVICGLLVFILSLKCGKAGWEWVDIFCLAGAVAGGYAFWQFCDDPRWGLGISLAVGFLGSIPTFVSAWKEPGREDFLAWIIWWVSCVLAIAAIRQWTLADAGQPLFFFLVESIMVLILLIRPRILTVERDKF